MGKTTFSYFDRNVPMVRRDDGTLDEPETVVLFHGYTASKGPMGEWNTHSLSHQYNCILL